MRGASPRMTEMGAPTWPNGFDVDPINLYMELSDAGALTRVAAE